MTASFRNASMLLLALTASACESTSAPEGALFGVWGGENAKLLAGPKGVRVALACEVLESNQPLVPGLGGRFVIENVESHWSWTPGEVTLRGTVSGPEITFEVVTVTPEATHAVSHTVRRGRKAELQGYCLLAVPES